MGWYIQTEKNTGKADSIIAEHGAKELSLAEAKVEMEDATKGVVCVVANIDLGFEAAGFCMDQFEFDVFAREDGRPKRWLSMERAVAEKLSGYKSSTVPA